MSVKKQKCLNYAGFRPCHQVSNGGVCLTGLEEREELFFVNDGFWCENFEWNPELARGERAAQIVRKICSGVSK